MGHQCTDTRDTQDTTKSPLHPQQATESAPGTQADCMFASSCSPGRLCPLCLCVSLRYGLGANQMTSCGVSRSHTHKLPYVC